MVASAIVVRRWLLRRREPYPEFVPIGRRMYALRAGRFSQLQMAVGLGVSEATYGRWESGHIRVRPPALARVARLLGVPLEALLSDVPPAPRPQWEDVGDLFGLMLADLEQLSPEYRELVLHFIRFLALERRRRLKGGEDAAAGGDPAAG